MDGGGFGGLSPVALPQNCSYLPYTGRLHSLFQILTVQAYVHTTLLIFLATQLEGAVSHPQHNGEGTPDRPPAAVAGRMI